MSRRFLGCSVLLGLLLVLPAIAADDKKPAAKDDKSKHVDSDLLTPGAYTGKLLSVPDDNAGVSVQIDAVHLEPKSKKGTGQAATAVAKEEAKVAQLEAELANPKSAKDYATKSRQLESALSQLQKAIAKAASDTKTVTEQKTVDFQLASDVKVRRLNLPPRFDDQGVVKPYTDEEKKALQGTDSKLPGYEAKLSDLQVGDVLRLTMGRKPAPPKTTDGTSDSDAKKDKDTVVKKTEVTIVVILNEDDANKDQPKPKDKASTSKKQ